jgi:DNA-binding CsgD family transcriptional regulator
MLTFVLHGRNEVQARIRTLAQDAEAGRGGGVVIIGATGEGKTAVLDFAADVVGPNWRILRCAGIECEAELAFAGLYLLLAPVPDSIDQLPLPQREALVTAFEAASTQSSTDRHQVGLGTLAVLAALSVSGPVLCLIDDAHWWDQPSIDALSFAARRLGTSRVVVLFAGRARLRAPGLPRIVLGPLAPDAARALLVDRWPALRPAVREQVLGTAAGNPLALLELASVNSEPMMVGQLALTDRLQTAYQGDIAELPEATRLALLAAAADIDSSPALLVRVLAEFGLSAEALDAAERCGVVTVSGRSVTFRHPVERAVAYRLAPFSRRLAVHAAIAAHVADPEQRVWHLAAAATTPNETVAAALEEVARRVDRQTGCTAAERAARLSAEPGDRVRRLLLAIEAAEESGQPRRALELADEIARCAELDPRQQARLSAVRARVESVRGWARSAHGLFVDAAAQVSTADPEWAAKMLIYAADTSCMVTDSRGVVAARAELDDLDLGRERDTFLALLDGPLALYGGDRARGVRMIRENVRTCRSRFPEDTPIQLILAVQSISAGDIDDAHTILLELDKLSRDQEMVARLPVVSGTLGAVEMLLGRFRRAEAALTDSLRFAREADQPNRAERAESHLAVLAAIRGDEDRCRELAEPSLRWSTIDFDTTNVAHAQWALGLLDLGYGRDEAAADRFETLSGYQDRALGQWIHLMSDRVEVAVRLRDPARAAEPMSVLEHWCTVNPAPWIEAHLLRCRGLLDQDDACFDRALALHAEARRWFDHARTGLVYGERLRRDRCKAKARSILHHAFRTFERVGAEPWAQRARTELRAAGGHAPDVEIESRLSGLLTPQELQVVRLAATGATNKEIAARLLISPKTVSHHLYRAFPKLGVSNRRALGRISSDLDTSSGA